MFKGEYNHTIDTKGRLIIPAKLREGLGDHFVVTRGLDGCLSIYAMPEWEKLEEKLQNLPLTNANARKFSRYMLSGAVDCEFDKMGRILLPQVLRQAASLEKDVVLIGVGSRIEIWNRDKWAAENELTEEEMSDLGGNLEGLGI
ncbi:MAG: division/cell wall cluster transcriptional repressor MraZ [Eubacteriales bacterium]|nr:division/cell wall cluster transcriptional repressor MraZ [Eubacteriales bacterium]